MSRIVLAAIAAVLFCCPAFAHGGGGGHGGGHVVVVGGYGGGFVPPPPAEVGDYSRIHTVAIISAIGETMHLLTPGGMFGSDRAVNISNWGLDDLTSKTLGDYLSARFALKTVPYDRAALAALPTGFGQSEALHNFVVGLPKEGVDAFIIVHPDVEGAYARPAGISVLEASGGYFPSEALGFEIDVYDAYSLKRIARSFSRIRPRTGQSELYASFVAPMDRNPGDTLSLTDAQQALLQQDFAFHLGPTLVETLRPLQFGLALPEIGARELIPIPPQRTPLQRVHAIGIVSAIGDALFLEKRETMFRHPTATLPVGDWQLDAEVEKLVASSLGKRFAIKPVSADRGALAKINLVIDSNYAYAPMSGLTPTSDVDAYVVVLKHVTSTELESGSASGLGLWQRVSLLGSDATSAYASYGIAVVDAHTLKPLETHIVVTSPQWPWDAALKALPTGTWGTDSMVLTPDQAATVHQAFSEIFSDSIGETLLQMGLTGVMVKAPPGYPPMRITALHPPETLVLPPRPGSHQQ